MLTNKELLELVCNSFYLLSQDNTYKLWTALAEHDEELLNISKYPFNIFNPNFAETSFWCDYGLTRIKFTYF